MRTARFAGALSKIFLGENSVKSAPTILILYLLAVQKFCKHRRIASLPCSGVPTQGIIDGS
ncbi:MAG: hypothetical protein A2909_01375 [Candidatus Tagabacteria bacterium RIFCSPLOWO2_01_FULL_39_11]|uniref:Uncharacterized protein n=1 Tax=Candidatus Tagabacteria bacterium RIFCSPLOWO2_01_FULL_39_11 TaxID=1802295 RepID=A0A1G2LNK5_9BACT|nr:MAG: hypothetical protein A2909_01375 [Candidatus Tagabacteria bacterium RIFCSPLOWO2_01_FULL_39_11]